MYTTFFGLRELPFPLANDLHFFYSTAALQKAEADIVTALCERKGLILLTGEPGTGKTTLLRRISDALETQAQIVSLPFSTATFDDILTYLCGYFSLLTVSNDPFTKVLAIQEHLRASANQGLSTVVCIDEAQNVHKETLDRLRLLLHLKGPQGRLLQLVLAGQPSLEAKLAHPDLRHIQQYVTVHCRLHPLSHDEVRFFIQHRLAIAGCERSDLFSPTAIARIADYSQHVPRLINVICDNALIAAYMAGKHTVSLDVVEEVAQHLQLDGTIQVRDSEEVHKAATRGRTVLGLVKGPQGVNSRWLHNLVWMSIGIVFAWLSSSPQSVRLPFTRFFSQPSTVAIPSSPSSPAIIPVSPVTLSLKNQRHPEGALGSGSLPIDELSPVATATPQFVPEPRDKGGSAGPHAPTSPSNEPTQGNRAPVPATVHTPGVRNPYFPPMTPLLSVPAPALHTAKTSSKNSTSGKKQPTIPAPRVIASPPSLPAPVLTNLQRYDKKPSRTTQNQTALPRRVANAAKEALLQRGLRPTREALFQAVATNNPRVVELLLAARAPINATDENGWTALMIAARDNNPNLVRLLLARGAAVNAKNKIGETALIQAAYNDHPALVQILLDQGASIDTKNNRGWTALMYAASKGHRLTVETLLNKGADARVRDKDGRTAAMYAAAQGASSLYEVQVRDPGTFRNRLGRLDAERLQLVKRQEYREIASLLKQAESRR